MKKIILISTLMALILPIVAFAEVTYLSEEEYKDLSKDERIRYWENLEASLAEYQQRKSDAIAQQNEYQTRIEELKQKKTAIEEEYTQIYNAILADMEVDKTDFPAIRSKIEYFRRKTENWNDMSDQQLWSAKKAIRELIDEYNEYKKTKYAKVPDFQNDFSDLDNRIANLETSLKNARPKYYEDNYTVMKGDWLSKIAGYSFIYGDVSKWPIIYRANRDKIKDPNLIYPDQVIKIPRGLPHQWKVYRGECLWRIASYPEVYDNATKWPLIYRANKDKIKDPDLIYPNQTFDIPRD